MSRRIDPMLMEVEMEWATTRRHLEQLPGEKLSWRPHPKSMSLGQLALHIAMVPTAMVGFLQADMLDLDTVQFTPPEPKSKAEVLSEFERGYQALKTELGSWDDAKAMRDWTLAKGGAVLAVMPRIGMVRTIILNHLYHHRGQMTVYFRLLDIPVPITYGSSADESAFG